MKKLIYLFLLITVSAFADDSIIYCDGIRSATTCKNSPGCYFDGQGSSGRCKLCPAGYYCDGSGYKVKCQAVEDCPPGSSVGIASGSAKEAGKYRKLDTLKAADCPRGYYCPEKSYVPLKCPNGTSSCKNSKVPSDCKSLEELSDCDEGVGQIEQGYIYGTLKSKTDCENYGGTYVCNWTEESCGNSGYEWTGEACRVCQTNPFGGTSCNEQVSCDSCDSCQCIGFSVGEQMVLCPEGYFCPWTNTMNTCLCSPPAGTDAVPGTTGFGAKDMNDCIVTCNYFTNDEDCKTTKGCYWNDVAGQCMYCEAGFFCDGQIDKPRACPYGSTSYPGSVSITECYIEEISVSSFGDNYKLGGQYYFNGYNKPLSFETAEFSIDMAGSVCK